MGRSGGAPTFYGRASSLVAGGDPVEVAVVGWVRVRVGGLEEVGGELVAVGGRAVRVYCAGGAETGVMVEIVVVGAFDRVPSEDYGGTLGCVDEVGGGQGRILDRSGGAFDLEGRASCAAACGYPVVVVCVERIAGVVEAGVRVGRFDKVGGEKFAGCGGAVGMPDAEIDEGVVVEIVVAGTFDRFPTYDE